MRFGPLHSLGVIIPPAFPNRESRSDPWTLRYLGDPVLTTPCVKVTELSEIPPGLIEAMREVCNPGSTRRSLPDPRAGLGLAANQVGALVRVILVKIPGTKDLTVMVNPVMEVKPAMETGTEGCLSIPGFDTSRRRHQAISVRYRDLGWQSQGVECTGVTARCVQHEIDHLDGRLFIDGLSRQLRRQAERAVAKARGE